MMTTKISADLHARVLAAESQLQIESPDGPEGKPVKARKTCQAALVKVLAQKKARSTNWNDHIMTKSISASERGLPHYRVRVIRPNATSHRGPRPRSTMTDDAGRRHWIDDHQYRDTIGLINCGANTSIARR